SRTSPRTTRYSARNALIKLSSITRLSIRRARATPITAQASSGLWPRLCRNVVTFVASSPRLFIALHSSFVMLMFIPVLFLLRAASFECRISRPFDVRCNSNVTIRVLGPLRLRLYKVGWSCLHLGAHLGWLCGQPRQCASAARAEGARGHAP